MATHARTHADAKMLKELRPHLVDEIIAFFAQYDEERQRKFMPQRICTPREGRNLIKAGMAAYQKQRKKSAAA